MDYLGGRSWVRVALTRAVTPNTLAGLRSRAPPALEGVGLHRSVECFDRLELSFSLFRWQDGMTNAQCDVPRPAPRRRLSGSGWSGAVVYRQIEWVGTSPRVDTAIDPSAASDGVFRRHDPSLDDYLPVTGSWGPN